MTVKFQSIACWSMEEQDWDKCYECLSARKGTELLFYNKLLNHWDFDKIISTIINCSADLVIIDDLRMIEHERNSCVKDRIDFVLKSIITLTSQISTLFIGTYCILAKEANARVSHRSVLADFEYDSEMSKTVKIMTVKNMLNECFPAEVAYVMDCLVLLSMKRF